MWRPHFSHMSDIQFFFSHMIGMSSLVNQEPLPLGDADAGIRITAEELAEFDGRELETHGEGDATHAPLYIAVMGRIYDVSGGKRFYGRGNSYHKLVGKDPTRAFCTGCLEPDCLIPWTDGLRDNQVHTLQPRQSLQRPLQPPLSSFSFQLVSSSRRFSHHIRVDPLRC